MICKFQFKSAEKKITHLLLSVFPTLPTDTVFLIFSDPRVVTSCTHVYMCTCKTVENHKGVWSKSVIFTRRPGRVSSVNHPDGEDMVYSQEVNSPPGAEVVEGSVSTRTTEPAGVSVPVHSDPWRIANNCSAGLSRRLSYGDTCHHCTNEKHCYM